MSNSSFILKILRSVSIMRNNVPLFRKCYEIPCLLMILCFEFHDNALSKDSVSVILA